MILSARLSDIDNFEQFLEQHRDQLYDRIVDSSERALKRQFRKIKIFSIQIKETADIFDFFLMMDSGHVLQYLDNAERYFAEREEFEQCQRIQELKQQIKQQYK
jgi:hypothetical protein